VLHDSRGTFISLSHFCPTAAALLFHADGTGAIVGAPAALSDIGELDGLDARGEWPPLLRPRVLMDVESYSTWERAAISLVTHSTIAPGETLGELEDVTATILSWIPGSGALQDVVRAAFDRHTMTGEDEKTSSNAIDRAVKRWLAARLFGGWIAYQGDGLAATLRHLRACLDTFTREIQSDGNALEAVRRSDLRIVHGVATRSLKR
jgi:hypothetical protein